MKFLILKLIRFYQANLNFKGIFATLFLTDSACKYIPTCSEYSWQAINKYGVLKGGYLSVLRIIRCHPFTKGGLDPIPQ
ncbi:MAG TPA: membrane protein insertion efficiency factor YidD [Patescibacteria group bacterium]